MGFYCTLSSLDQLLDDAKTTKLVFFFSLTIDIVRFYRLYVLENYLSLEKERQE